ncbi:BRI1 kinase inhibitor 1 [Apium graveolens]|uniref:BRI1 kinase inhibitor 1 n=1 Tax=Apium graveolens TaxID=4045 RepID=UPI003D78E699
MEIQKFQKNSNKSYIDCSDSSAKGAPPTLVAPASPPSSSSSSPAHEFSFTISFHQQHSSNAINNNNNKSSINSPSVDLSPADDIFFHGHLLPLHLLSHLPVSPRSSTNSLDSFTLPITELFSEDEDQMIQENSSNDDIEFTNFEELNDSTGTTNATARGGIKSRSFSIFGGRKKGNESQDQDRQKKKLKYEVSEVLKKYMKMLRPLLPFRGSRKSINKTFHNQSYSFPGSVSSRKQDEFRGRRGLFSAPASMRASPTNSGLLVATGAMVGCSTSDSTMEELQAAIQSAITHCKNSSAVQEKIKCQDH